MNQFSLNPIELTFDNVSYSFHTATVFIKRGLCKSSWTVYALNANAPEIIYKTLFVSRHLENRHPNRYESVRKGLEIKFRISNGRGNICNAAFESRNEKGNEKE